MLLENWKFSATYNISWNCVELFCCSDQETFAHKSTMNALNPETSFSSQSSGVGMIIVQMLTKVEGGLGPGCPKDC